MQIVLVKYIQLFCMTLSFSNRINCDKLFLHSEVEDKQIYYKTSCTANCMKIHQNLTLDECFKNCQQIDNLNKLKKIYETIDIKLLCRDDSTLAFKIIHKDFNNYENLNETATKQNAENEMNTLGNNEKFSMNEMYVIKVHKAEAPIEQQRLLTNSTIIKIDNLLSNTIYNITAVLVNSNYEYSLIVRDLQYETLQRKYLPNPVSNISLVRFEEDQTNKKNIKGIITWKPAKDMTCFYNILCYPSQDIGSLDYTAIEIRDLMHLYTYTIDSFAFGTEYLIGIRSINTKDSSKESELKYINVTTPSCLEWHLYDLNICPPLEPKNLQATETLIAQNEFSINISWDKTIIDPDYYTIKVLDLNIKSEAEPYSMSLNVTKDQNSAIIPSIILKGHAYEVYVIAHSPGGNASSAISVLLKNLHVTEKHYLYKLLIAIIVLLIVMFILVVFIIMHRRGKLRRYNERCKYFEELEKKAPINSNPSLEFSIKNLPTANDQLQQIFEDKLYFNDKMEISRNNLELYEKLGEGAFGLVRRGVLITEDNKYLQVAVKMFKGDPSVEDIKGFRREIETMKSVGKHENIVGIIGHYTRNINEMMLLTEYCSRGNLLVFLRSESKYLKKILNNKRKDTTTRKRSIELKETYYNKSTDNIENENLTNNDMENNLNFDTSFVDKISLKYKNVLQTNDSAIDNENVDRSPANIIINRSYGLNDVFKNIELPQNEIVVVSSSATKCTKKQDLFECTNFCKCQVNIINNQVNDESTDSNKLNSSAELVECNEDATVENKKNRKKNLNSVEISNCKCHLNHISTNLEENENINSEKKLNDEMQLCVENKEYFKTVDNSDPPKSFINENSSCRNKSIKSIVNNVDTNSAKNNKRLSSSELLNIAKQVALGMEFLSKCKVVHRDLAARNVLVCSDKTIKIADFGLSRDIYQENIYKKTGNGRLPIKWLALESMTHSIYTTQSDVWSFGILLYEIATLGETPYQGIPTNRLPSLLKSGYRMERPANCSQKLYDLMKSCWNAMPNERPTFTDICHLLDDLTKSDKNHIENLEQFHSDSKDPKCNSDSDDSYLKPID